MIQRCAGCNIPSGGPLCNLERWAEDPTLAGVFVCPDKRVARLRPMRRCLAEYCKRERQAFLMAKLDRDVEISKQYWGQKQPKFIRLGRQLVAVSASGAG
jgi:hypothetical protein